MKNKQIVVDNLLTTYSVAGKGPVILFLHGWGDDHNTFNKLSEQLQSSFTVVSLDLPGFGKTEAPHDIWNLDNYAAFIAAFANKTNHKQLYSVIAHSNGGSLAIRGIAEGKFDCDKLVLLGSAGIRNKEKGKKIILKTIAKTGKATTFFLPPNTRQKLRKKMYGVAGSDMLVAPHLEETFKKTVKQDVQKDAQHIHLPTLLIYGENDIATPPSYGKIYKQLISNAQLRIIPGAGHFVHQDQAEQTTQLIMEFLSK